MNYYTSEKNVQMLIYLMKKHGIKKVIASPGTTNITFVASIQHDDFFDIISCADERSAAYMACGIAEETGEPVALSCTGATASRNYIPGLTEAFYRKLPILAITSTQHEGRIGQLEAQVIDRSNKQNDIAVDSENISMIHNKEDEWDCNIRINRALLSLKHNGGGPVHINLWTNYSREFNVQELPEFRVIYEIDRLDAIPPISHKKVAIFVGAHAKWNEKLTNLVDDFCELYNAVVLCDHSSNYNGKYGINYNLISSQKKHSFDTTKMDILIDIGEMSGAYMELQPNEVWRVSVDGEIKDRFKKISNVFSMREEEFFEKMIELNGEKEKTLDYYNECKDNYDYIYSRIPELPFSNIWIAKETIKKIPSNSVLHLGILNSLRSWNFFKKNNSIECYSNTGGFGIDGILSAFVGGALSNQDKPHFLVIGDLAFFYDLNGIANKNVTNNIRIILVNNGCGTEFKNYSHFASRFNHDADEFIAASGHYGNKSKCLVKNYCENLGFDYYSASNKDEYNKIIDVFTSSDKKNKPILLEVFTNPEDESRALELIDNIIIDPPTNKEIIKNKAKNLIGEKGTNTIKKVLKRGS